MTQNKVIPHTTEGILCYSIQCFSRKAKRPSASVGPIAENDILFDEGLAYARKLDEAGVPTTIETYNGFIDDYGLLNPLDHIEAVKFSSQQGALALKKVLFKKQLLKLQ